MVNRGGRAAPVGNDPPFEAGEVAHAQQSSAPPPGVERFSVSVERALAQRFDALVRKRGYRNRSQALADLMRAFLVEHEWQSDEVETVGTVTLVYDHDVHELADRLTDIQHLHHDAIVSSMHVHLDASRCLEVLVVKGRASVIRDIADRLISVRGVKHGKLTMTSSGRSL